MAANQPSALGDIVKLILNTQAKNLPADDTPKFFAIRTESDGVPKVEQFPCEVCKAVFYSQDDLTAHVQTHKEDGAYACDLCKLIFSDHVLLANHKVNCEKKRHTSKGLLNPYLKQSLEFISDDTNDDNDDDAMGDYGMEEILKKMDVEQDKEIDGEIHAKVRNLDTTDKNDHKIIILSLRNKAGTNSVASSECANIMPSSTESAPALKPAKLRRKKRNKTSDLTKYTGMLKVVSEDFLTCHKENIESLENFAKHVEYVMEEQWDFLNGLSFAEEVGIKSATANLENLAEYLTEELGKQTANLENFKESMKDKLENIVTKLKELLAMKNKEKKTDAAMKNEPTVITNPSTVSADDKVLTNKDSVLSNSGSEDESADQGSYCVVEEGNTDDLEKLNDELHSEETVVSQSSSPMKKAKGNSHKRKARSEVRAEKKEGPFSCDICGLVFALKCGLSNHKKKHSRPDPNKCPICGKIFKNGITTHLRMHTGERPYQCNVCGKRFNQSAHLKTHVESHNTERRHQCELCGKAYKTRQYLLDHMKLHVEMYPHTCETCGKGFLQQDQLERHMRKHDDLKCELCDITFDGDQELDAHNWEVHGTKSPQYDFRFKGKKKIVCEVCGKKINKNKIAVHMRIHKGLRPYKCKVCELSFTQGSHLRAHMFTHTGEKPHKCSVCDSAFAQKGNLKDHMRLHTGAHPFVCEICGKSFNHRNNMKKHVSTVHRQIKEERLVAVSTASFDNDNEYDYDEYSTGSLPNKDHTVIDLACEGNITLPQ